MLYVDAPVGTGFSYSTTEENYYVDDYKSANETYQFLRKVKQTDFARLPIVEIIRLAISSSVQWLIDHPQYQPNQLYIGGDTYTGITLPIIVQKIFDGDFPAPSALF